MATTVTNANTTAITDPTGGAAPWSVATITTATVNNSLGSFNTENVTFYLRGTNALSNGAISADYVVGTDGKTLIPTDQIFYEASGGLIATYYGTEANNPALAPVAAIGSTPGFTAADPGFLYTQYIYSPGGALQEVVAAEANGKIFVGSGTGTTTT